MARLLRLKCPACQTLIETTVEDELRVTLQCAACHKHFNAKVPPRHVASRPVSAQPHPFHQPPIDPLFEVPPDYSLPVSPASYQPVRKRKPLNLRPVLAIVSGLMGLLLAIFSGLYVWHWASTTDWSTFSVVPDSHERLTEEWFERIERDANENAKQLGETLVDVEQAKHRIEEGGAWSETMLVRAVRLGKAPLDKKAAFKERQEALDRKARSLLEAKLAELKASGQTPSRPPELFEILKQNTDLQSTMIIVFSLPAYMGNSLFDLPAPTNDTEKIYYEEADLVHDYLKQLTFVRNSSQSLTAAEKVQALADKIMELAVKRSKMPANRFERVPREYVSKDKGFEAAQKALVARIRRDTNPDETLKDAVANFNDARDLLIHASEGLSDVTLRSRFAEVRKIRSETTKRGPNDLFLEVDPNPSEREMVIKPRRQSEPDPVLEPPKPEPKPPAVETRPQPAPESVVSNTPPVSQPTSPPPSQPSSQPVSPFDSAATNPTMNPGPLQSLPPSPRPFDRREQAMQGVPPHMRPNLGPPIDGQAMVFPSQGFGGPQPGFGQPGAPEPPPLDKAESVKIIVINSKLDGNEIVKRLTTKLESGTYRMNFTNGKVTVQIQYTGDLNRVVKLIDFGRVTLIDTQERTIHVTGSP